MLARLYAAFRSAYAREGEVLLRMLGLGPAMDKLDRLLP